MEFITLKEEVKNTNFKELRIDCDNCFEAVVVKEELAKLTARLEKFFGLPAWPSQNRLSFGLRQIIDSFGGIIPGQTLYFWNQSGETIFAMLWPWKDREHTTVKIFQK